MLPRVTEVLNRLLQEFKDGSTIPEAIAYSSFPKSHIPSASWSVMNQIIMFLSGTHDARGYRQWQAVKRHVKKGVKSFDILVPQFKKEKVENSEEDIAVL